MKPEEPFSGKLLNEKIYFPNLNGIRFIAAFLVIIHHVEQFKFFLGLDNYWHVPSIYLIGKLGVILFFVLSGYLITYLLLAEENKTGTISIRDFYIRRLLRIWPLYYLVSFISFFVLPNFEIFYYPGYLETVSSGFYHKILLFLLFLPNLANLMYPALPYLGQAWSVGVEEQFYLIWPQLMKRIKNRLVLLWGVVIVYLVLKAILYLLMNYFPASNKISLLYAFWESFSIDCMAIGGIMAYLLFTKNRILEFIFKKWVQAVVLTTILICILMGVTIPFLHYEFYGILFAIFIINLSSNHNRIISFENSTFDYLGKISYGLYMYHPLCIMIALKVLMAFHTNMMLLQLFLSLLITIVVSAVSYHLFEHYFIRRKLLFSRIVSGDNVKR